MIARCTLVSPRDGLVLYLIPEHKYSPSLQPEVGGRVVPGQKLIRVCDRERYQVRANIDESMISRVKVGQNATVRVEAMPGRVFEGKVLEVSKTPAPRGRDVRVYPVTIALDEKLPDLRPGMSAEATILGERRTNVLRIPIEALFSAAEFGNRARFCLVKTGDGYQDKSVILGFAGNSMVEVAGGLREGDLVLGSSRELAEGIRQWLNDESLLDAPGKGKKLADRVRVDRRLDRGLSFAQDERYLWQSA